MKIPENRTRKPKIKMKFFAQNNTPNRNPEKGIRYAECGYKHRPVHQVVWVWVLP